MATLKQVGAALRAADAAGNVDDARRLAKAYAQQRSAEQHGSQRADFGDVKTGSSTFKGDAIAATNARNAAYMASEQAGVDRSGQDAWQRQERAKRFQALPGAARALIGAGSTVAKAGRGLGQLAAGVADYAAPRPGQTRYQEAMAGEDAARMNDSFMAGDGYATAGKIGGEVGMMLVPMSKLSKLAGLRAVGASAAMGAGIGGIQPVSTEGGRGANVLVGGALGGAGAALAPVIGGAVGAIARPFRGVTQSGATGAAANAVRRSATDSASLNRAAPSSIDDVTRTLGEETLDPGIIQLQRQFKTKLQGQYDSNDAARVAYLRSNFGGATKADVAAQRSATQQAQTPGLMEAKGVQTADPSKLISWLSSTPNRVNFRGNTDVSKALGSVRSRITTQLSDADRLSAARKVINGAISSRTRMSGADYDQLLEARRLVYGGQQAGTAADDVLAKVRGLTAASSNASSGLSQLARKLATTERGSGDVATLYETRKHITTDLLPKALRDGDGATAKALQGAVKRLDDTINQVAPTYAPYLKGYKSGMRTADQVQTGVNILNRGAVSGLNDVRLQPGRFLNATRDLDKALPASAVSRRVKAEKLLEPRQVGGINSLRDDLLRVSEIDRLKGAHGSDTAANFDTRAALSDAFGKDALGTLLRQTPIISGAMEALSKRSSALVDDAIVKILANPQQARALLEKIPQRERSVIVARLTRAGGAAGSLSGVAASGRN